MIRIFGGTIGFILGFILGGMMEFYDHYQWHRFGDMSITVIAFGMIGGFIGVIIAGLIEAEDTPVRPLKNANKRINVFAGSIIEADLIKLHLQERGIDAELVNEQIGALAPYVVAGGSAVAVNVSVSVVDESKARELIERQRNKTEFLP